MKRFSIMVSVWFVAALMAVPLIEGAYPTDPTADIVWLSSCGYSGVASIQCAFNNARSEENEQLDTSLPMLTLPSQAAWDAMSDGGKALWLINRERIDRGIHSLVDIEVNVTGVAETYAEYLLANNAFSHDADGRTPWERLADNPAIGACHDYLSVAENLAAFVAYSGSIPLPVERSVYAWMYEDTATFWSHRHAVLWYPYNDNSGSAGMEGFLGIGRANGGPYQGWAVAEIMVMNVFDPCASWADFDSDGIPDGEDNCVMQDNPGQEDADSDGIGDVCDACTDTDHDGYGNPGFPMNACPRDNCPDHASSNQHDADGDCIGDVCDPEPEVYDPSVPDIYPPGGNGCGDTCECHADCNSDQKVDLADLVLMKGQFMWNCSQHSSCEADCNYDNTVNLADLVMMKAEFNRTGCPVCP